MSSLLAKRLQSESYESDLSDATSSPPDREYEEFEESEDVLEEPLEDFSQEDLSEEKPLSFGARNQSGTQKDDWFSQSSRNTKVNRKENWFESMLQKKEISSEGKPEKDEELVQNLEDNFGFSEADLEEAKYKYQKEQENKRYTLLARISNIALILGCAYLIFLIFGVSVTRFHYGDKGRIEPQVLGIKDIRAKKEFEVVQVEYEKCQMIYEKMLIVNYRLENTKEDPKKIVTEYQPILADIDNFKKKNSAVVMPNQYAQLKDTMQSFYNISAIYCQKITSAYTNEKQADYNDALISWYGDNVNTNGVVNQFIILHQNVVALGQGIDGVDLVRIEQWNPDTYVENYINGKEK